MRVGELRGLVGVALLALSACGGSGPLGPIVVDDITIELGVSGGFAGLAYAFEIDGETGAVRGVTCESFCDFEPGELILTVSAAQVADIAQRLERADVFGQGGDHGNQCCDQIYYTLRYTRGARSVLVQGTGQTLPGGLSIAISHAAVLATGRVPTLVAPETADSDWPRDAYALGEVEVTGSVLRGELTYSGGCAAHPMDLVLWGGWMESLPVQVRALITHDDQGDACDAVVSEERSFDLTPLMSAYRDAYGPGGSGPRTVVLQLWDPMTASPTGRLIDVHF